jgi:hypothetical protein
MKDFIQTDKDGNVLAVVSGLTPPTFPRQVQKNFGTDLSNKKIDNGDLIDDPKGLPPDKPEK